MGCHVALATGSPAKHERVSVKDLPGCGVKQTFLLGPMSFGLMWAGGFVQNVLAMLTEPWALLDALLEGLVSAPLLSVLLCAADFIMLFTADVSGPSVPAGNFVLA